jgi:hypothetical protein
MLLGRYLHESDHRRSYAKAQNLIRTLRHAYVDVPYRLLLCWSC